ncbi:MAG: tRNA (N6-threonylcarbamoyladenosine(37)-N6)-methyltransferase TrmO [Chloroflexota bacterium]
MQNVEYQPIGIIRSPFKDIEDMPIQPTGDAAAQGTVEILPEFTKGLADLDGFSHIILIYHFHRVNSVQLTVTPFLHNQPHGVFATRAPTRPNPIGISIVKLIRRDGATLHVANIDVIDGTPLLDIKPYVPQFDAAKVTRLGWLEESEDDVKSKRADNRFG